MQTIEPLLLKEFINCKRHCWCAYDEGDPIVKRLEAGDIVRGFKVTPHEHGTNPEFCTGCLMEAGKIKFV